MAPADYHPMRTQLIRRDLIAGPEMERLACFRANAAMKRLNEFADLHGFLESDGRPIIDISTDAVMLGDDFGFSTGGQIDQSFKGTVFIHFGALPIDCLDGGLSPTGAYVSATKNRVGGIEGKVIIVTTENEWVGAGVRPIQDILTEHVDMRLCQSASKIHPLSASNFDPPGGVDQRLACPALAGVAAGRPSAGNGCLRL